MSTCDSYDSQDRDLNRRWFLRSSGAGREALHNHSPLGLTHVDILMKAKLGCLAALLLGSCDGTALRLMSMHGGDLK